MPPPADNPSRARQYTVGLIILGVVVLIVATGNATPLVSLLYNRYAALIAVIVLVEYVILKGFDRSAQYGRQLESLRARRHEDLATLEQVEQKLERAKASLDAAKPETPAAELETPKREIESALELLGKRK